MKTDELANVLERLAKVLYYLAASAFIFLIFLVIMWYRTRVGYRVSTVDTITTCYEYRINNPKIISEVSCSVVYGDNE